MLVGPLVLSPPALLATTVIIGGVAAYYYYQQQSQVASPDDYLISSKPNRSAKPKNCPSGTKPIDDFPDLDSDDIHEIKKGLGARPDDWVGITPDGDVITGGDGGQAVNQGPYKDYLPWNK
ncbi:MAG: hypothetical protein CV088_04815 [Nitrospira sp. LK70]|nr:hypothetical protein [Nitrospira sp. LK70]